MMKQLKRTMQSVLLLFVCMLSGSSVYGMQHACRTAACLGAYTAASYAPAIPSSGKSALCALRSRSYCNNAAQAKEEDDKQFRKLLIAANVSGAVIYGATAVAMQHIFPGSMAIAHAIMAYRLKKTESTAADILATVSNFGVICVCAGSLGAGLGTIIWGLLANDIQNLGIGLALCSAATVQGTLTALSMSYCIDDNK